MRYLPICVVLILAALSANALDLRVEQRSPTSVVSNTDQDDFDKLLVQAWNLYQERKYDEVIKLCEKLIVLRPDDNRGYAIAGAAYMGQFKMQEASDVFALAIKFSPGNPVLRYNKAKADRFRNAKEEGLASVRKAIELKPDYAEAYLLLGDLLGIGAEKDPAERISAFRKAIELKPDLLEAYRQLGMVLKVSGDKKGAEETYRKALAIDPKHPANFFDLGRLLVDEGRLAEARELWEKRPPNAKDNTFPNFITVLERAEKQDAAKQASAKDPNDPEALVQLGLTTMEGEVWVVNDRWERAIVHFKKALEIKPDLASAQHGICKALVQWAYFFKSKNKELDEELVKLRKMDAKLADEIVEYRKSFVGGLRTGPPPPKKQ